MNITAFEIPKVEAKEKYKQLLDSDLKTPLNLTRKRVYYALSKGNKVIDIYTAMEQAGLNVLKEPRIAICRADAAICYFHPDLVWRGGSHVRTGGGIFSKENSTWRLTKREPIRLTAKTFPDMVGDTQTSTLKTVVPQIPQEHMPKSALHNYYILWEVDKWVKEPPRDPFLLRRLSKNLFEILAEWDLTELEWSIARGAI